MDGPAPPVLAINELPIALARTRSLTRTPTGCIPIDEILHGGVESGRIVCLSGATGVGKSALVLQVLVRALIAKPRAQALVLDAVGGFDVVRLESIVQAAGADADDVLGRVRIVRVFDFVGVQEAVDELKAGLMAPVAKTRRRDGRVLDSEDEESDEEEEGRVEMVVLDNLTSVVGPLLKSNYIQAQAVLGTFMRGLAELTRKFGLTTLVINGVVMPRIRQLPDQGGLNPTARVQEPSPSIFAANTVRPALGRSFAHYLDLHLLLSVLPKSERDARIVYGGNKGDDSKERGQSMGTAEMVNVVEVLADRYSDRTRQWTAFRIEEGIELNSVF
ncbi:P-loop containing nucleoside triphosphate hydrolase protein [Microthyrium microscopicum]|uniref:P-loop containing nucleoside triphosphate hydrolase protein n=1 Tax=Microthyrium microscopicum TaxID=703497 RepID=A0A6A6U0D4_9PEZI|nr:P-loop containing nucleoside triphosphate hydrolase protein [Microthyrium microscopicum]